MASDSTPPVTARTLGTLFEFTYNVTKQNADGFTHEDSVRPPKEAGNCLNWVLGHIIAARHAVLGMLGQEPVWTEEELKGYRRGSRPNADGSGAMDWTKMLADYETTQERLRDGFAALPAERLSGPAPEEANFLGLETFGETLAAFHFHESYHSGQVGILRRVLGREGMIG